MANVNRPFGLAPHSYLNGSKWTGQATTYVIPSTDTTAYAIGDPVTLAGSADARGNPSCIIATAGTTNLVLGAIVSLGGPIYGGVHADPGNLDIMTIPATKSKDYYVMVADDPNIIFTIQEANSGTALAATDVGLNVSLKSGTNNGYLSGWTLDNATEATTAALQLKLLGLLQTPDNAIGLAAIWRVLINQHCFKAVVAGV